MRRRVVAGLLILAVVAGAGLISPVRLAILEETNRLGKAVVGQWSMARRAAARAPEPPFARLAATQLGFAPAMVKRFSAPSRFTSFHVLDLRSGSVAWTGGPPVRQIETDLLGPIRSVWIGDFSGLRQAGRYHVVADNGLASFPFDVGTDVFDRAIRAVQRWFYFQRAFTEIQARHAEGPWIHPSDVDKAPPGVAKGWHDAGDLNVYNATMSTAIFWMLEAFNDFKPSADDTNIPESGNGVPDLLDETRWGLEWLLSMQDGVGGAFRGNVCLSKEVRYGRLMPQDAPGYIAGAPTTFATARAAGTLAYAAAIFRAYDSAFSERCLRAALAGYAYLRAHWTEDTDDKGCPARFTNGDPVIGRHARMYAAAGLLLATGEERYRKDFEENYEEIAHIPNYHRVNGYAARLYLRAPPRDPERARALHRRFEEMAAEALSDGERHPFEWASDYYWGSINDGFHRTGLFNALLCLEDPRRSADCEQALANVHYAFGRNYAHFAYVSGIQGVTRGMTWSYHYWLKALDATPHNFPGMVAGGPNASPEPRDVSYPSAWPGAAWGYWGDPANPRDEQTAIEGRYTDNDSWSTNEPAVNFEASTLYSLYFARWRAHAADASP